MSQYSSSYAQFNNESTESLVESTSSRAGSQNSLRLSRSSSRLNTALDQVYMLFDVIILVIFNLLLMKMQTFLLPIGRQQIFNHLFCSGITCCHYYQKPIEQLFWKNSKKFNEFDLNKVFVANCKICTTIPHSLATIFYFQSFPALTLCFPALFSLCFSRH